MTELFNVLEELLTQNISLAAYNGHNDNYFAKKSLFGKNWFHPLYLVMIFFCDLYIYYNKGSIRIDRACQRWIVILSIKWVFLYILIYRFPYF